MTTPTIEQFIQLTAKDSSISGEITYRFKNEKCVKDAQVSFDGGQTWLPFATVHAAVNIFVDRYPLAFSE